MRMDTEATYGMVDKAFKRPQMAELIRMLHELGYMVKRWKQKGSVYHEQIVVVGIKPREVPDLDLTSLRDDGVGTTD